MKLKKENKKLLIILFFVISECILLCCFVVAPFTFIKRVDEPTESFVIVVDAGHGGIDGGVTGVVTKVKESDLNLLTSKELKKQLESRGAFVVMTRKDKNGLYGNPASGFKLRDMKKRREIIQESNPDLVVSIHMNKFSDSGRSGPQVFFQSGDEKSKQFAQSVQQTLNQFTDNAHQALRGDFYICQCADVPSIIVECGFLSNPTEEALLCDSKYRAKLCDAILKGIFLYLYSV